MLHDQSDPASLGWVLSQTVLGVLYGMMLAELLFASLITKVRGDLLRTGPESDGDGGSGEAEMAGFRSMMLGTVMCILIAVLLGQVGQTDRVEYVSPMDLTPILESTTMPGS